MGKIRVLIADDHLIIRDGIKLILKRYPDVKIVSEASNGVEVINYLSRHPSEVDVILLDINMPELNGIDTAQIISQKYNSIKILALTMHIEETYIIKMIKVGALGYILKESSKEQLLSAIKTVAQGKRYYSNEVSVTLINSLINSLMNEDESGKSSISERESEVLGHIVGGFTNIQIGEKLFISSRTVETHRRNLLQKLEVRNTVELVRYAVTNGLVA